MAPEGDALGSVESDRWPRRIAENYGQQAAADPLARPYCEKDIMNELAGDAAVSIAFGKTDEEVGSSSEDERRAMDLALSVSGSEEEAFAYIAWLRFRARRLLEGAQHWRAVEELASALVDRKSLGYRAARKVITEAFAGWNDENGIVRVELPKVDPALLREFRKRRR